MFNVYVHDYCMKRGFLKTAAEFRKEAHLSDTPPPIQTKQGFIFEWWSVFWVTFDAKTRGDSAAEATLLYIQHTEEKAEQHNQEVHKAMMARPNPGPPPIPNPQSHIPPAPRPGPVTNGAPPQRAPVYNMPNGHIPNGIPPPPGPNQMQPPQSGFPGNPQPNGAPHGPMPPQSAPGFPPMPANRGPIPPPPVQQRVNGQQHYQGSPSMAHSPPQGGPASHPPPPTMHPPPHPSPMGGQMPTPHMRGVMPPPNGMPAQHPSPSYNGTRPPSRQATPGQPGIQHPSPSLRPVPLMSGDPRMQEQHIMHELSRVPQETLYTLRLEQGFGNRDVGSLTFEEKFRLLQAVRQSRMRQGPGPSKPGPPNHMGPPQHPSNMQRGNKRPGSAAGEDDRHDGDSPPNAKRQKPSPPDSGPMHSAPYPPPPQPGHPNVPVPGGMRMGPPGAPSLPGQPMYGAPGMMHMGHMQPGMPMPPQHMGPPMTQQQYRANMHAAHQTRMPMPPQMPPGTGEFGFPPGRMPAKMPPPPSPAMATKDGQAQQQQGKKEARSAETSPGTAPATPAPQPPASAPPTMEMGGQVGGSSLGGMGAPQQNSQPPVPQPQQQPPQQQQQSQQQQSVSAGQANGLGGSSGLGGGADGLGAQPDFLQGLFSDPNGFGDGMGDINADLLSGVGAIDFERDYGQWFNEPDMGGLSGVDVK